VAVSTLHSVTLALHLTSRGITLNRACSPQVRGFLLSSMAQEAGLRGADESDFLRLMNTGDFYRSLITEEELDEEDAARVQGLIDQGITEVFFLTQGGSDTPHLTPRSRVLSLNIGTFYCRIGDVWYDHYALPQPPHHVAELMKKLMRAPQTFEASKAEVPT